MRFLNRSVEEPAETILEVNSLLALCPKHPLAERMRAAVPHTEEHHQVEASGQLFTDGTYAIDGKINDCYWARMDARGEVVDNNFVSGAGRVQVTIRPGDHSFTSEG